MKILISPLRDNALSLMRRAGYTFQRQEGAEMSFVRALGSSGYPRFHGYARQEKLDLSVNLHLDQKKHTYGEGTRHHGEYAAEGPLKEEVMRLLALWGEDARIQE